MTEKLVWQVVKEVAARIGIERIAPLDLVGHALVLCRAAGGELERIQFFLGSHANNELPSAENDRFAIEPASLS